ncbi:MAG: CPBP family intramembrane metalloprotease [Anaerolineales bacterium]|nr:CPBP family intramembrane metalloprotease [Anaerolineales bacterium]
MIAEKDTGWKTISIMQGFFAFVILFVFQVFAGKFGWAVADLFSYDSVDRNNLFARLSIHHLTQMLIALTVILIINAVIRVDFGFHLGEIIVGMRYLLLFTGAIAVIALGYHILMEIIGQPITYDHPLNIRNILGTLGFQLFLSGPSEEILYRALPVTLLVFAFGKSISISKDFTLEVVLASLLFAAAHVTWTTSPFSISELNIFGLVYAFTMGILNGFVYQKSGSIVYPILMHSISNVFMVGTGYLFAILF